MKKCDYAMVKCDLNIPCEACDVYIEHVQIFEIDGILLKDPK